jgi:cytochrome c6
MKNITAIFSLGLLGIALVLLGCGDGRSGSSSSSNPVNPGLAIYKKYCVTCHGADGKMGLNGAANLAISTLSKEESVAIITNGRKMMAPYKSILTEQEISQVADHVLTLRQ